MDQKRLDELRAMFVQEPFAKTLGASLDMIGTGRAVVSLTLAEPLAIANGIAQAGVTLSLGDYAGVYAAMSVLHAGHVPASDCSGYFTRPVKVGGVMRARARVEDCTKSCIAVHVTVSVGGRRVSTQTWKYAKPKT
jgi:acyl-coenzyme A thioesterase PaaI-like protein